MPISVDEIENGDAPRAETPGGVVVLLASHAGLAYAPAEIAGALGVDRETVLTALTELAERDLVRRAAQSPDRTEASSASGEQGDPRARLPRLSTR